MKKTPSHKSGLSIIEIMIGIFIFTLGMSAIFLVISSTVGINSYNKNFIIASNLAREQIELVRNIRDTNYKKFQKWDMVDPSSNNYTNTINPGDFYSIDNSANGFHVKINKKSDPSNLENDLKSPAIISSKTDYRVCINAINQYTTCEYISGALKTGLTETFFYKYLEVKPVDDGSLNSGISVANALKIRSKVYWYHKGVHDTEIDTIITDWKRL